MSAHGSTLSLALIGAVVAFGCGSQPVPLVALPGSTVSIAIGAEDVYGNYIGVLGFGSEALDANAISDVQRGELRFVLLGGGSTEYELETRLVTRVYPDPTSKVAIQNASTGAPLSQFYGISQAIAMVDIPLSVPPGTYPIQIRRMIGGTQVGTVPYPYSLQVLDRVSCGVDGQPNGFLGFNHGDYDTTVGLGELYPYPKVVIDLGVAPPAAVHLVLDYPEDVSIQTVIEEQNLGRGSIVLWQDDAVEREVTVDFADPAVSVRFLAVAFDPAAPVTLQDFAVAATYYDADGNVIPGSQPTLAKIR